MTNLGVKWTDHLSVKLTAVVALVTLAVIGTYTLVGLGVQRRYLAVPVLVVVMAIWGAERLWQRAIGRVSVDGLLWKPNLYYTPEHTWITWQGLSLRVGLDDLAQRVLVGAQAIELPRPGEEVREGQTVTVVQYGNKRAEIASPVDGVIAAVNEAVREDPSVIHRDPYDHGWLYAVVPKNFRYTCLPQGKPARNWFRDEGVRLT